MTVSTANVDSEVSVAAAGSPQVGVATTLTSKVAPAQAGGTVTFTEHGTLLGEAPVQANGVATLNWVPAIEGARTIDVAFSGREGVNSSTGDGLVTVAAAEQGVTASTTTIDALSNSRVNTPITLTARVGPSGVAGTVTYYDGDTAIGTVAVVDGVATVTWTPTTEGPRTITAVYDGDGFLDSQDTTRVTILPAPVDPIDPGNPGGLGEETSGSLGSLTGGGEGAMGSLGSLTGSLGGGTGGGTGTGSLGSLSSLGS